MRARAELREALHAIGPFDAAVALAVAAIGQQEAWLPYHGSGWSHRAGPPVALAVATAMAAGALAFRRRSPLAVVITVTVVLSAEYLAFGASDGLACLLPPLLALYAAGRHGERRHFPVALALTAVGLAVHEWRDSQFSFSGPSVIFWSVLLGAGVLGRVLNTSARDVATAAARARDAALEERTRIARELHDLVGHGISLLVLQLVAVQGNLERGQTDVARERLARLEETARSTLGEMRRLVAVADDDASLLPQPGVGDLPSLVDDVRRTGVRVELDMCREIAAPPGVGLAAYRIVQEALTNVIKHAAPAARTRVAVGVAGGALHVDVSDSGPAREARNDGGRGLAGMRERVALYGGRLDVGPSDDGGFRVHASFPLEGAAS